MKKHIISLLVIIGALNNLKAQDENNVCTPNHERALFSVKYFLTASDLNKERISSGNTNIPIEEIKHVNNEQVCVKLNNLINSNAKYKEIATSTPKTKFFYQTNNFYYIFWSYADSLPRTGPKRIFIVVNNQFNVVGEFYI